MFSMQNFMSQVVRDELREMDMDIELQERIYAEIEDEIFQWLEMIENLICSCEINSKFTNFLGHSTNLSERITICSTKDQHFSVHFVKSQN